MLNSALMEELIKREHYLHSVIVSKEAASKETRPEGRLRCANSKWGMEYYHVTSPKAPLGKYIPKKDHKLAAALAQKDYDRKTLQLAAAEYKSIHSYIAKYRRDNIDTVFEGMHPARRNLVIPVSLTDEQFLEKWQGISYERKEFSEGFPEYYTAKGERVRSKSEVLIADTLNRLSIPYHYEYPFKTKLLGVIHPDFLVLNLRLRRSFFWEHCGRMDDPDYCRKWIVRLSAYSAENVFPGSKLIQTFETEGIPINSKVIERTIHHYLD